MQTSDRGIAFLERHEGVVLKAYRCPAGVWTIGAGLTAASGVIKPKAGMVISRAEASRLLAEALRRNYEPGVRGVMPGARQHEFDAGVSFHFNTGAIGRASWVRKWIDRDWPATRASLMLWVKGGGKVLPGLTRRRSEEFDLLHRGDYGLGAPVAPGVPAQDDPARIAAPITAAQLPGLRAALAALGYAVGVRDDQIASSAVRAFQHDHALSVDGIIGRATGSGIQRVLDARARAASPVTAGVAVAGAAEAALPSASTEVMTGIPHAGEVALMIAALRYAWLAFGYRDTLAAALTPTAPRLAALLRSF